MGVVVAVVGGISKSPSLFVGFIVAFVALVVFVELQQSAKISLCGFVVVLVEGTKWNRKMRTCCMDDIDNAEQKSRLKRKRDRERERSVLLVVLINHHCCRSSSVIAWITMQQGFIRAFARAKSILCYLLY